MMRAIVGACLLLSTACSSGGSNGQLWKLASEQLRDGRAGASQQVSKAEISRAQIDVLDLAIIRVEAPDQKLRTLALANRARGNRVSYLTPSKRQITLKGGLVVATQGFGFDLLPMQVESNDPIAFPLPPNRWPEAISRTYFTPGRGPDGQSWNVRCNYSAGDTVRITLAELNYTTRQMIETCEGGGAGFRNLYFVDERTGLAWQSRQWAGPDQGYLNVEVLEPLD